MSDPNALRTSGTASADREELSDSDLLASCRGYPRGSREHAVACDVLVRRYTPLVRACVRQYWDSPESLDDLMQVGYVGLLKAIGSYNPAFGNRLRACAMPCVTGEIKRHFRDKRWQVRATRPVRELMLELRGAREDLTHELGRLPVDSELAGRLGVTPDELREARRAAEGFSALSLKAPAGEADDAAELRTARRGRRRNRPDGRHASGDAALGRAAPPGAAGPHLALLRQPHPGGSSRPAGPVPDARVPAPGTSVGLRSPAGHPPSVFRGRLRTGSAVSAFRMTFRAQPGVQVTCVRRGARSISRQRCGAGGGHTLMW